MLRLELTNESVGSMARELIEEGVPDQPFEGWRGGMLCLTGKSLYEAAKWMIEESPKLRYVPFRTCGLRSRKRSEDLPATTLPESPDPLQNPSNRL